MAELENPRGYGRIVRDSEGNVGAVVEEKDADAEQRRIAIVNTGVLTAEATALKNWLQRLSSDNAQGEYYLTDVFAMAAAEYSAAEIVFVEDPVETEGANDPWQLAQLERAMQRRRVRELCAQGARFADPDRVDIRGEVIVGRDVEIDASVVFEGRVVLGDGVRIGPFCRIRDAELGPGTEVRAHCDIDGARTEGAVQVGPFARLRPGTVLADGVHVGNFVETKNAQLGVGTRPPLSYLGDARIGRVQLRAHHHLQLRRRQQVHHHHPRWRLHRLEFLAGGAGDHRRRRHHRRRIGDRGRRSRRQAHRRPRPPAHRRRLAAPHQIPTLGPHHPLVGAATAATGSVPAGFFGRSQL